MQRTPRDITVRLIRESCYEEHAYRDCRIEASPGIPCIPRSCITIANKRPPRALVPIPPPLLLLPFHPDPLDGVSSSPFFPTRTRVYTRNIRKKDPRDLYDVTTRGREEEEEEEGNEAQRRENFVSFIPLHSKAVIYARVEVKRNASERERESEADMEGRGESEKGRRRRRRRRRNERRHYNRYVSMQTLSFTRLTAFGRAAFSKLACLAPRAPRIPDKRSQRIERISIRLERIFHGGKGGRRIRPWGPAR